MEQARRRQGQTMGEEFSNVLTHALGAGMAITATVFLLVRAAATGDLLTLVSMAVYGGSLILLFLNSAVYHAILPQKVKAVFQVADHCSIYLLILGTYTAVTLNLIRGTVGWILFGVVAGSAVLGIILNCISLQRFKALSMALYVASGWAALFAFVPLSRVLTSAGWVLLVGGGAAYTLGLFFFGNKRWPFMHFVWHLFVLAGAVLHFIFVYLYCF